MDCCYNSNRGRDDDDDQLIQTTNVNQSCCAFRYVVVALIAGGCIMDYVLRINISFAVDGGMIPKNCTPGTNRCWNQAEQGYVLSSFLWGYWVTQVPGAVICCFIGATKVIGIGTVVAIVATFLGPIVADVNLWLFIALRMVVGFGLGVTCPVNLYVISTWAPDKDVGFFTSISTGGIFVGAVLANAISGVLATGSFMGGWPSVFHVYGIVGVIWAILWFVFVNDDPSISRWVSDSEKEYLRSTTIPAKSVRISEIPWRSILSSGPAYSVVVLHICNGYGFYMLLTDLPKYMVEVLEYDIQDSGFLGSVPFVMLWLGYATAGYISDKVILKGILSKTWTRKWCGVMAMVLPAILLFCMSFLKQNIPILVMMNIAMFFQGAANSSLYLNYMDLSPRFSAVICGFGNGLSAVSGLIGPVFVGWLINDIPADDHKKLAHQWQIAFISASVVWIVGSLQFVAFGSAERQAWDDVKPTEPVSEHSQEKGHSVEYYGG